MTRPIFAVQDRVEPPQCSLHHGPITATFSRIHDGPSALVGMSICSPCLLELYRFLAQFIDLSLVRGTTRAEIAVNKVVRALTDKGICPEWHDAQLERLRGDWPVLGDALADLVQACVVGHTLD